MFEKFSKPLTITFTGTKTSRYAYLSVGAMKIIGLKGGDRIDYYFDNENKTPALKPDKNGRYKITERKRQIAVCCSAFIKKYNLTGKYTLSRSGDLYIMKKEVK